MFRFLASLIGFFFRPTVVIGLLAITSGYLWSTHMPETVIIDGKSYPTPKGFPLASGTTGIPLIGDALDFLASPFQFTWDRFIRFGNASYGNVLGYQAVMLSGSEGMKLYYNTDLVQRTGGFPGHFFAGTVTRILNMLEGEAYNARRHIIMSAVADKKIIEQNLPLMQNIIDKYIARWQSLKNMTWVQESHMMMAEMACSFILDVNDGGKLAAEIKQLNDDVLNGLHSVPLLSPSFWKAIYSGRKAHALYSNILDKRIEAYKKSPPKTLMKPIDIIASKLLESDVETRYGAATEIHHMMMATEALVANAISDMTMSFSLYPKVKERASSEVKRNIQDLKNISLKDLAKLRYLNAVADETRRTYAFVPGMFGLTKKDVVFQGIGIPKGTRVLGAFFNTNHHMQEWIHPEQFNPDRFLSGKEPLSGSVYWSWVPQGTAHHQCPGLEFTTDIMKLFAVHLFTYDATWQLPQQPLEQKLSLFNPEIKSGLITTGFSAKL